MRPVPETAVRDRDRPHVHLDPLLPRALPRNERSAGDRVRLVRVPVRIAPRPELARHGQLALDALERGPELLVGDRPVDGHAVTRTDLEVGGMEPRQIAREVRHLAAHAGTGVVLPEPDRVVAGADA